jgi:putative resolvase
LDAGSVPETAVGHGRVSSHEQRADLDQQQVARVSEWATWHGREVGEVVCEVGSGLNGKRPKLGRILSDPSASVVVVEHQDRLARFGMEHLEAALAAQGRRIVVADPCERDDLVRDMIEVLTSICARCPVGWHGWSGWSGWPDGMPAWPAGWPSCSPGKAGAG